MSRIPIKEIKGQPLTPEQTSYLEGLFAGLSNRGVQFADVMADPAATPAGKEINLDDLIFEEQVKQKLHPLDAHPQLVANARDNTAPSKEDGFRFKWQGLFYLSPNKDGFMCRLRIPGGVVKTFQLRELASVSEELTTGYVQVTTRSNFQLRLIEPKDAPALLERIQSVGLHSRGAGGDNIRNLTANPTAGIDPYEVYDVSALVKQLSQHIINTRHFYDLPRKFNIALDGGGLIGSVEDTNDIGLKAVKVSGDGDAVPAGVYFRMKLGGATGHKSFASDVGVLIRPEELIEVTDAVLRVFIANGNRGNRKKARLKHLLEEWTLEQYMEEVEKLLGRRLIAAPLDEEGRHPWIEEETLPEVPHSHVGVYPQKQDGLNYVGVALPVGQITPRQMMRIADVADNYGSGEIRLTVWQNLILPNIPDAYVETVKKALLGMGLDFRQSHLKSGLIACTGNAYCKFAASNTKGHAAGLAEYLEPRIALDQPINIHLTGCPHSCAQHYMGDIGLLGASAKKDGETVEGYHVFVGGGFGKNARIGRQLFKAVAYQDLKPLMEKLLKAYQSNREEKETFYDFSQRFEVEKLVEMTDAVEVSDEVAA